MSTWYNFWEGSFHLKTAFSPKDFDQMEKTASEMYVENQDMHKAWREPSNFLIKALFTLCLSWHRVLHWWKAETPKPRLSARQSETLNAFGLLYVNEESRLLCCLWGANIRLRVCSLGGRADKEYIELKNLIKLLREEWRNQNHFLICQPWSKISSSFLALLWWRSVFMCIMWRSADTFLQVSFVQHCHCKPECYWPFPKQEILVMGCSELQNEWQTLLSSPVHSYMFLLN